MERFGICYPVIGKYSLGRIGEDLVTIGGQEMSESGKVIGDIYKYHQTWPTVGEWRKIGSPMPTPRCWPSVACSDKYLATCGGSLDADGQNSSSIVEILEIKTMTWRKVHGLPFQGYKMSSLIFNDKYLFVANSYTKYEEECQAEYDYIAMAEVKILLGEEKHDLAVGIHPQNLYSVSPNKLLPDKPEGGDCKWQQSQQSTTENPTQQPISESSQQVVHRTSIPEQTYWGECEIVGKYPILAKYGGCAIAINDNKVYAYSNDTNKWYFTRDLSKYLKDCNGIGAALAVLPNNDIMLIGGQKDRTKGAHRKVQVISLVKDE